MKKFSLCLRWSGTWYCCSESQQSDCRVAQEYLQESSGKRRGGGKGGGTKVSLVNQSMRCTEREAPDSNTTCFQRSCPGVLLSAHVRVSPCVRCFVLNGFALNGVHSPTFPAPHNSRPALLARSPLPSSVLPSPFLPSFPSSRHLSLPLSLPLSHSLSLPLSLSPRSPFPSRPASAPLPPR